MIYVFQQIRENRQSKTYPVVVRSFVFGVSVNEIDKKIGKEGKQEHWITLLVNAKRL